MAAVLQQAVAQGQVALVGNAAERPGEPEAARMELVVEGEVFADEIVGDRDLQQVAKERRQTLRAHQDVGAGEVDSDGRSAVLQLLAGAGAIERGNGQAGDENQGDGEEHAARRSDRRDQDRFRDGHGGRDRARSHSLIGPATTVLDVRALAANCPCRSADCVQVMPVRRF